MQTYPNINKIILASASPRRRELLSLLGVEFSIQVPEIDEVPLTNETPVAYAERLAKEKRAAVQSEPETVLIAADTIVVLDGHILEKPVDNADAARMLSRLSGNTHHVITGVCIGSEKKQSLLSVSTEVTFRILTETEIDAYVATGDPMDKAGAYAIQGGAAHMVESISGSYTNVVGLPLSEVHLMLASF